MKNWKTTLIGFLTGGAYAFLSQLAGGMKPRDAAIAVGMAALGTLCKDHNVTGGAIKQ